MPTLPSTIAVPATWSLAWGGRGRDANIPGPGLDVEAIVRATAARVIVVEHEIRDLADVPARRAGTVAELDDGRLGEAGDIGCVDHERELAGWRQVGITAQNLKLVGTRRRASDAER